MWLRPPANLRWNECEGRPDPRVFAKIPCNIIKAVLALLVKLQLFRNLEYQHLVSSLWLLGIERYYANNTRKTAWQFKSHWSTFTFFSPRGLDKAFFQRNSQVYLQTTQVSSLLSLWDAASPFRSVLHLMFFNTLVSSSIDEQPLHNIKVFK